MTSTHPVHRYASVADITRVAPRVPTAAPWASSASVARLATPNGAVDTGSTFGRRVPAMSSVFPGVKTPLESRRTFEVHTGLPSYDRAAGKASPLLLHGRLQHNPIQSPVRAGTVFHMHKAVPAKSYPLPASPL